jgi:hypothetical protein
MMGAVLYLLSRTVADPDLWGHVRFGLDILGTGRVEQADTYSYLTGDVRWINHEWLAEVILAWIFSTAGPRGLIAFKTAAALSIVGALHWRLVRTGLGAIRAAALTLLVSLILVYSLAVVRPHLFTLVLFLILLVVLSGARDHRDWRLWLLPPLFAVWANLHGGFIAGLAVLVVWCAVRSRWPWPGRPEGPADRASVSLTGLGLASAAATLLNPYGWHLVAFLLASDTFVRPEIVEWRPLDLSTPLGALYLVGLGGTVLGLALSRRTRDPAAIVVLGCLAVAPFAAERHLGLSVIGLVVLAGEHVGDAWRHRPSWTPALLGPERLPRGWLWTTAIAMVLASTLVRLAVPNFQCIRLDPGIVQYPTRAVALLVVSGTGGNLAVEFDWGEYALWHLGPRIRVSIDGRRETVYSSEVRRINQAFAAGVGDWDTLLERHDTQLALVRRDGPTFNLLGLVPGWDLLYQDGVAGLFGRERSPASERVRETAPPALPTDGQGLCFP